MRLKSIHHNIYQKIETGEGGEWLFTDQFFFNLLQLFIVTVEWVFFRNLERCLLEWQTLEEEREILTHRLHCMLPTKTIAQSQRRERLQCCVRVYEKSARRNRKGKKWNTVDKNTSYQNCRKKSEKLLTKFGAAQPRAADRTVIIYIYIITHLFRLQSTSKDKLLIVFSYGIHPFLLYMQAGMLSLSFSKSWECQKNEKGF